MAHGDGPHDADLLDGWERFCDRLREAGAHAFKDPNPPTDLHRVDAFRFFSSFSFCLDRSPEPGGFFCFTGLSTQTNSSIFVQASHGRLIGTPSTSILLRT